MLSMNSRTLTVAGLAILVGAPAMASGPVSRPHPAVERPAADAAARPAQTDDMQALIEATREIARSTGAAADSIGMDPDRLSGILMRLDRIEARVKRLDQPASHSARGAEPGWR